MKPYKYVIRLAGKEKRQLRPMARGGKSEARLADRARIILWAHDRVTIDESARRLGCHREKVIFWRKRFLERRKDSFPDCLQDLPRPGRPPVFSPEERELIVFKTLEKHQAEYVVLPGSRAPRGVTVCSSRDLAAELSTASALGSVSHSTVVRTWQAMEVKPWRWHYWLTPTDPDFAPKSRVICKLYRNPPDDGTLLCFDEKPGIQILERKYPGWPLAPGHIALVEHEYIRHSTLDLLAAFEVSTGWVFGRCYHRHRAVELVYFLDSLHRALPFEDYGVLHLVSDNARTRTAPETMEWMAAHPGRVVWHFLPTHGSWLNQIEIWFSIFQRKCLARGSWCDYDELKRHILAYIRTHNRLWAHPYQWTYKGMPLAA